MFRLVLLIILMSGCAAGPVRKEFRYNGEAPENLGSYGVLVGHAVVPLDDFPHDRKTTIIYFEDIKSKAQYQYGDTRGPFFMKLPPGDYVINDLWVGGGCNSSMGFMISNLFSQLPDEVAYLRDVLEKPAAKALGFRIHSGKQTDVGNLLMTCFEWDSRERFRSTFTRYIQDGKFQVYRPMNQDQHECGCKILRKHDGKALSEMKRALNLN